MKSKKLFLPTLISLFFVGTLLLVGLRFSQPKDIRNRAAAPTSAPTSAACQSECPYGTLLANVQINLTATPQNNLKRVSLTWTFSGSGAPSGFRIYRATQDGIFIYLQSVCGGSSRQSYDYQINPGLTYRYKVVAFSIVDFGEFSCRESTASSSESSVDIPFWNPPSVISPTPGSGAGQCSPATSCNCPPRILSGAIVSKRDNPETGNAYPNDTVTIDVGNPQNPACYGPAIADTYLWKISKAGQGSVFAINSIQGSLIPANPENYPNLSKLIYGSPIGRNWSGLQSQKITPSVDIQLDKIKMRIFWHTSLGFSHWVQARIVDSRGQSLVEQDQWGHVLWSAWAHLRQSAGTVDGYYYNDFVFNFWEDPVLKAGNTYYLDLKSSHDLIRKSRQGIYASEQYINTILFVLAGTGDNGTLTFSNSPTNSILQWQLPNEANARVGDEFILTPISSNNCGHGWCKSVQIIIPPPPVYPAISSNVYCSPPEIINPPSPGQISFGDTVSILGRGVVELDILEDEYIRRSRPDPLTLLTPERKIDQIRFSLAVTGDIASAYTKITPWYTVNAAMLPDYSRDGQLITKTINGQDISIRRFTFNFQGEQVTLTVPGEDSIPSEIVSLIEKFTVITEIFSQGQWQRNP